MSCIYFPACQFREEKTGLLPGIFLHHAASADGFCVEGGRKPCDLSARIFSSSGPYFSLIYLSNARFLSSGNKRRLMRPRHLRVAADPWRLVLKYCGRDSVHTAKARLINTLLDLKYLPSHAGQKWDHLPVVSNPFAELAASHEPCTATTLQQPQKPLRCFLVATKS